MAAGAQLNLDSSIVSHSGATGINNAPEGTVRISNNDFSFNSAAVYREPSRRTTITASATMAPAARSARSAQRATRQVSSKV
jgi:hypothetical protein